MRRASFLITFFLLWPALYTFAAEERLYIGVWQKGTGAGRITPPMLWPEFLKTGDLSIPRRDGAEWIVVNRNRFLTPMTIQPVWQDARYSLYRLR